MEYALVKDVLAEAVHMGLDEPKSKPGKELLREFGFAKRSTADKLSGEKRYMEDIKDITTYFEEMTGKDAAKSPREAVAGRRRKGADDPEMAQYNAFVDELRSKGAADNVRKTKWSSSKNELLEKRMVSCVANAAQEVQAKCLERTKELNAVGVFSDYINEARSQAHYKTELLRKLRLEQLRADSVRLVDCATPQAMAQTIMAGWSKDSFELALERHIRDKDEQDRMAKDKANAPPEAASAANVRRKGSNPKAAVKGTMRSVGIVSTTLRASKGLAKEEETPTEETPPVIEVKDEDGVTVATGSTATVIKGYVVEDEAVGASGETASSPTPVKDEVAKEAQDVHAAVQLAEQALAAAKESGEGAEVLAAAEGALAEAIQNAEAFATPAEAAHEDEWVMDELDARNKEDEEARLEVVKKRRRRRKRLPPSYVEYAQLRQQEMDAEDARKQEISQHVMDSPRTRKNELGQSTKGRLKQESKLAPTTSPFESVSNDILMTKQKRQALADESRWEDVSVSKHVVLRTSLPMAAPRVPQLIVNPPSYDNVRSITDANSSWLLTGNKTEEIRSLVTDIYQTQASAITNQHSLLPGAAPADFTDLQGRMPDPPEDQPRAADRQSSHIIAATKETAYSSHSSPSINIMMQRRLEAVWDALEVPPMEKLDHVLKYGRPEFAHKLESSLEVWEKASQCVTRREVLLRELNNLKNSSSALKGSNAVGERMQRLAVAVCEQTRACVKYQNKLLDDYADILKFRGLSYHSKLKRDIDQELISLLPTNYDISDLQFVAESSGS